MMNNLLPFILFSKDISELGDGVINNLETKDMVTDFMRKIGEILFDLLKMINDSLEKAFTLVLNFDFSGISQLQIAGTRLQDFAMSIGFIVFVIFVVVKFLKFENLLGYFYNVLCTLAMITIFGFVFTFMHDLQKYGMQTVKYAFDVKEQETTSDMLYRNATVDLKQSVQKNKVIHLSEKINRRNYDYLESLPHSIIDTKYEDGKVVDLDGGVLGTSFLEEKYYRYKTDYWEVVITLIVMAIIYIFSIYKGAYLAIQGQLLKLLGTLAMAIKLHDAKQAAQAIGSVVNNVLAIFILYLSVTLFSVINANLITTNYFDSLGLGAWFVKAVFILACGMMCILGGTEIDKLFGIDSGSGFMMKSAFFGGKMLRGGKKMAAAGAASFGLAKKGMQVANDVGNKFGDFANDRIQASMARRESEERAAFAQDAVKDMWGSTDAEKDSTLGTEEQKRLTDSDDVGSTLKENEKVFVDEDSMAMRHDRDPNFNSAHNDKWNRFEDGKKLEKGMDKKYPDDEQIDIKNHMPKTGKDNLASNSVMDKKVSNSQNKQRSGSNRKNPEKKLPEWYNDENKQKEFVDTHDYNDNELQAKMAALRANSSSDRKYKNPDDFYDAVEKHGAYTNSEKANMWNDYQKGKDFEQVVSQHSKPMEIKFSPSVNSYNDFKKKFDNDYSDDDFTEFDNNERRK